MGEDVLRFARVQMCIRDRVVTDRYGGQLPADFEALLALPGIGRYSAGAIASIAFGLPVPAVDGNVLRVLSRCLLYTSRGV